MLETSLMMDSYQLFSIAIVLSYFAIILVLFGLILTSLPRPKAFVSVWKKLLLVALTGASLAHTWYYLLSFFLWSFAQHERRPFDLSSAWSLSALTRLVQPELSSEDAGLLVERIGAWLWQTRLFEQAWWAACASPQAWWWSEQVCLFAAGAWTLFVATEGRLRGIKHLWAYMLLGQLVAISVSANLFFLAVLLAQGPPPPSQQQDRSEVVGTLIVHDVAPLRVWAPLLGSFATIALAPYTSPNAKTFLPNLLLMHALLFVPLLSPRLSDVQHRATRTTPTPPATSLYLGTVYIVLYLSAILIRGRTVLATWADLTAQGVAPDGVLRALLATLHANPAQASIGWDGVWTTVSFAAWLLVRPASAGGAKSALRRVGQAVDVLLASPLTSVGVSALSQLRPNDDVQLVTSVEAKKKD